MLLLLLAGLCATPARAAGDVVQFGSAIDVDKDATIQDAVCFFCSVNVKGTVKGDIVVFFGSARVDGQADQDVVVFFGDVDAADDASIGQDLVNFFGTVRLDDHVTVDQDAVVMFGSLRAADTATVGGDRVVEPEWVFWGPFLAIALGIGFLVQEFRSNRRRRMLRGY
jgi:hypothetical protein